MTQITRAFVLAAGLGKRLHPLTDHLPKPLVPIFQKPLITFALDHLIDCGVESFVINTHRLPELFAAFFASGSYARRPLKVLHEPELLETGGGIKNAEPFLGAASFITYSADILSDVDLRPLIDEHFRSGNQVTLALRETNLGSDVLFRDGRVLEIARGRGNYDFANIALWNREIFKRIPAGKKVSFIPVLAEWIANEGKIGGVILNDGKWFNIGSPAEYLNVHRIIAREGWKPRYIRETDWPVRISSEAQLDPTAQVLGCSAIGDNCRVSVGAKLIDTVLWPGAQIASQSELRNCIVRSHQLARGTLQDVIV